MTNTQTKVMFKNIADKLIVELRLAGIGCYIYHVATTGSVYIRFNDQRMCSIRIGDHNGKEKLKYKFNLRSDYSPKNKKWVKDNEIWRCYLPIDRWKELIPILKDRHTQIQGWAKGKYDYHTPSFKKETPEPSYNEIYNG